MRMDVDKKLVSEKGPILPQATLPASHGQAERKRLTIGRMLVLSIAFTALSVVVAAILLVVPIFLWSIWFNHDILSEIKAFIQEHSKDELDRLSCMLIVFMLDIIILIVIPVFQKLNFVPGSTANVYRLGGSWKRSVAFVLYMLAMTGGSIWSNWTQYLSLVDHRIADLRRPLFGKRAEAAFLSIPNPSSAIEASRAYATKPHMAGTVGDLDTAKEFLELLRSELGISDSPPSDKLVFKAGSAESQRATRSVSKTGKPYAWIDTYYPIMNTPEDRLLEIVDDNGKTLLGTSLVEFSDPTDPDASKYNDAVPTFHGLSRGGDVTGPLVDGNYCTYEDYQNLIKKKGDIKGSIVLCRYGGIFRGLKVKGGEELGAVGVLIYSDPRDDGTVTNYNGYPSYPYGPARNPTSVQRGSVQYLSIYAGDPTTPGYPSYENSTRTEGTNIPSIPSLPISWTNANLLFRTLTKGDAFEGKRVRLVNHVNTRIIPIWNTLGVIPGFIKNEVVVVGNHRDAWVLGAADPSSGTASVHEIVRGLGHLLRNGWKPLRTILIASWDAEEYGLIGSTEWGEDFKDWIDAHVVAYLNLDSSVSGSRLHASASPLLAHFIRDKAEQLPHPTDEGRTLWDARNDQGPLTGRKGDASISDEVISIHEMQYSSVDNIGVAPLGSGSDYTVFLQRSGIPSSNGGFSATLHDPVYHYHSIFDSQRWQELYADPGFVRHVAVAKHLGLQVLGVSSSPVLPFNATHYAYQIESYLQTVEQLAAKASIDIQFKPLRNSIEALQEASITLDEEKFKAQEDLRKLVKKWKKRLSKSRKLKKKLKRKARKALCKVKKALGRKCVCRHKDSDDMDSFTDSVIDDATAFGMLMHEDGDGILSSESFNRPHHKFPIKKLKKIVKRIQAINQKTAAIEKGFISEEGIKDREWFRHLAVAPGKWLGYGATTFPGLSEAITFEKNETLAQYEAGRLESLIDKIVENIQI